PGAPFGLCAHPRRRPDLPGRDRPRTHLEDTVTDRNDHDRIPGHDLLDGRFSRGGLLKGAAALGIGMSPLLAAACGGGSSSSTAASSSVGAPRRGGQLALGFVSGGTAET